MDPLTQGIVGTTAEHAAPAKTGPRGDQREGRGHRGARA